MEGLPGKQIQDYELGVQNFLACQGFLRELIGESPARFLRNLYR